MDPNPVNTPHTLFASEKDAQPAEQTGLVQTPPFPHPNVPALRKRHLETVARQIRSNTYLIQGESIAERMLEKMYLLPPIPADKPLEKASALPTNTD